ncbi:GntR family transcriptional regulator [Rathayibacter sp. VKM Ac-2759]|uniref:GntR family transcriptional regulator n=1 Tax=Rathayibacter sp. VKM Ac-2759 TaxID=2609252 RepID=UPI0013189354|nr:GntR family transcriptional regulator [Rathayibacter sp. VKM Ac-2759]QHC68039.1 GntR family transcriptional regulator [Rathayibacter sp. VKM Ac-2759]
MTLPKLAEPTLLADQVYATLQAAIFSGELPAGARLRIRDLAEQVGTSVMPVREAIRRLEEAGLAESEAHKGAVVKGLSLEELLHVYGARRALEIEAARLGSLRVGEAECDRMQAEWEQMRTAIAEHRELAVLDHDEALLSILYEASGNPVLVQLIRNLWQRCRAYKIVGARGWLDRPEDDTLWRYQEAIIAAAREHDAERAGELTRESLVNATGRIEALLAEQRAVPAE